MFSQRRKKAFLQPRKIRPNVLGINALLQALRDTEHSGVALGPPNPLTPNLSDATRSPCLSTATKWTQLGFDKVSSSQAGTNSAANAKLDMPALCLF